MLTGAGLRDDAGLAHTFDQKPLTQGVVDLVGTSVIQILPLQEDPDLAADPIADQLGEPGSWRQSRGAPHIDPVESVQLLTKGRISLGLLVDPLQLVKGANQGLRYETSAIGAEIGTVMGRQGPCLGGLETVTSLNQQADGTLLILGGDQAFSYQNRIGPGTGVPLQLDRAKHSGLGHLDHILGQVGSQPGILVNVNIQVLQIPGVDADHPGTGHDGPLDLLAIMRFDQGGHA